MRQKIQKSLEVIEATPKNFMQLAGIHFPVKMNKTVSKLHHFLEFLGKALVKNSDFCHYHECVPIVFRDPIAVARYEVITHIKEGRPSKTIVEQSEELDVDMVIIGSRGIGGITGWVLGSTSKKVVDQCKRQVLVIK